MTQNPTSQAGSCRSPSLALNLVLRKDRRVPRTLYYEALLKHELQSDYHGSALLAGAVQGRYSMLHRPQQPDTQPIERLRVIAPESHYTP